MTDENRGIHVPRDVAEPAPAMYRALEQATRYAEEATSGSRAQLAAVGTDVEDRVLAGLRLSLQHLDPVVLRHTAAVAEALTRSGIREDFMLRVVERARTDPEFAQDTVRAETAVRSDSDSSARLQALEDRLYERPEFLRKLQSRLPEGITVYAIFATISMGVAGVEMAPDGLSDSELGQIVQEITNRGPDLLGFITKKKSGKDLGNTEE